MAIIKCKMCGGDLELMAGQAVATCEYCGTTQTVPSADNEKKMTLFSRATRLLRACEFDKAAGVYESLIAEFPEEAEAYWGLVLCKYGIEYVDDPATGKKIPTCHRSSFDSVLDDDNFEQAQENADVVARKVQREEAKAIEELRKRIIEVSGKEEPYDIFICYKETAPDGDRTLDSVLAQDIYDALTEKGYRVFFSRVTLEDKLGQEYEPYIFAALNSAKVMLAIGTEYEYYNAVWVKNEWSRFLKLIASGQKKTLIPCFKNMDPYDMPKEFAKLQSQDLGKVGAIQDLLRGIGKIIPKEEKKAIAQAPASGYVQQNDPIAPILRRGELFLEDENWQSADEYFDKVLDMNPECGEAYLGKLMIKKRIRLREDLCKQGLPFDDDPAFQKVKRFGDAALVEKLLQFNDALRKKRQHLKEARERSEKASQFITGGDFHIAGLRSDGTVIACGDNEDGQCNTSDWTNVVAIAAGSDHTVGLRSDHTVLACGSNTFGQCNLSDWKNVSRIFAIDGITIGRKMVGGVITSEGEQIEKVISVVSNGLDRVYLWENGRVSVVDEEGDDNESEYNTKNWSDITAVAMGEAHTVGLKADGTVVAAGDNGCGQCRTEEWSDIVAVSAGSDHTIGLRADGTVVAVGSNENGQCDVAMWSDIVAVIAVGDSTYGLRADGTVVACGKDYGEKRIIADWTGIVAVKEIGGNIIGLRSDGTVVATPEGDLGDAIDDLPSWKLFDNIDNIEEEQREKFEQRREAEAKRKQEEEERRKRSEETIRRTYTAQISKLIKTQYWTLGIKSNGTVIRTTGYKELGDYRNLGWSNITDVTIGGNFYLGLQADGTVVADGENNYGQCDVSRWRDIVAVSATQASAIGLRADGTVVATGNKEEGICDVGKWTDIVAIAASVNTYGPRMSKWHQLGTVGLRANGTVVSTDKQVQKVVGTWKNIISISVAYATIAGLKADGTVEIYRDYCKWDKGIQATADAMVKAVKQWSNIVSITVTGPTAVGLKADGTVVAAGRNVDKECDTAGWTDIVSVCATPNTTVGLRSDGTVVATGLNFRGQCNVSDWTDIIAITGDINKTVGLKTDGTVVAAGEDDECKKFSGWKLFSSVDELLEKWGGIPDTAVAHPQIKSVPIQAAGPNDVKPQRETPQVQPAQENYSMPVPTREDQTSPLNSIKALCDQFLQRHDRSVFKVTNKLKAGLGIDSLSDSDVYLAHDDTVLKTGKTGFAITKQGIYCREAVSKTTHVSFETLARAQKIRKNLIGNFYADKEMIGLCTDTGSGRDILQLFLDIAKAARDL